MKNHNESFNRGQLLNHKKQAMGITQYPEKQFSGFLPISIK